MTNLVPAIRVRKPVDAEQLHDIYYPAAQPVSGFQVAASALFARPSDTTPYSALDAVSNSTSVPALIEFTGSARALGGSGVILSARHLKNSTAIASFRLHLYRASTASAVNDNAQFALLFANRSTRIGFIDFAHSTGGTGSDSTNALSTFVNLPFICDAATSSLFGILTTTSGYTPASAEQHFIELQIGQN
jgi:hypothetical protein